MAGFICSCYDKACPCIVNKYEFILLVIFLHLYIGAEKEQHPFYVESNWNPVVQQSVALERYLEEEKISLAEIKLSKPENNLPPAERDALNALTGEKQINLGKADKGTNTVGMSREEKPN